MTGLGIATDKMLALRGQTPEASRPNINTFIQTRLGGDGSLPEF